MGLLPLFVAIPLFSALVLGFIEHKKWIIHTLVMLTTSALVILAFATPLQRGFYFVGGYHPFVGITLMLDPLNRLLLIVVQILVFVASWYSIGYMEQYTAKSRYFSFVFLMLAGMNGIVITADFFNLYVYMEIATIASYALVAYGGKAHELEASFKYLVLGSISSLFILLGIALIYSQTAALNMMLVAQRLDVTNPITWLIITVFAAGFGLKSALFPFHSWLPDAHSSAPAPVSAILSGVLIKVVGIYVLLRFFFNIIGIEQAPLTLIAWLGALSSLVGVLLAMGQHDFKRLLACHSVSQVGYIFIGIGLGTPLGLIGALLHIVNHSAFKSLLFLSAGSVEHATGERNFHSMGGLAKVMPWTNAASFIGFTSIGGVPPLNGFWSKLILIIACVASGQWILGLIIVVVAIMTLTLFPKIQKYVFLGDLPSKFQKVKESPWSMIFPMLILCFFCITLGALIVVPVLRETYFLPAAQALLSGKWLGVFQSAP